MLIGQDVFLPYSAISQTVQRQLFAVTAAARRAGYPLKIALIASRSDLGVVPALFGKPGPYARFLSSEIAGVAAGPVLVVMPAGFGLAASGGSALSTAPLRSIALGAGTDTLGRAAIAATTVLAARAGHPLPAGAATGGQLAASAGTVRHAIVAIAILLALAALAIGGGLAARRRAFTSS